MELPDDITQLHDALEAVNEDAKTLVAGLSEEAGTRRGEQRGWSVAECLDHLATANRVYLRALYEAATQARLRGKLRRHAARPGIAGRLFIASLEPPPKWWSKLRAPRKIRPQPNVSLAETFARFMASQADVLAFLDTNADLDLAAISFRNPFIRGIRFSLATGLHVIAAHDRRHIWQAWRVRRALSR